MTSSENSCHERSGQTLGSGLCQPPPPRGQLVPGASGHLAAPDRRARGPARRSGHRRRRRRKSGRRPSWFAPYAADAPCPPASLLPSVRQDRTQLAVPASQLPQRSKPLQHYTGLGHPRIWDACAGQNEDRYCAGRRTPLSGSGTTLIAAEKSGRVARLMELDPRYVDVIVRRWQAWTGKAANRESDRVMFDELAADGNAGPDAPEEGSPVVV